MKKIKVCRSSGMPVNYENIERFEQDYKQAFDKIVSKIFKEKKIVEPDSEKEAAVALSRLNQDDHVRMERLLNRVERSLKQKYPNVEYWDLLKSKKAMKEAVQQHGPIMLAIDGETNDLAYVIFDTEI